MKLNIPCLKRHNTSHFLQDQYTDTELLKESQENDSNRVINYGLKSDTLQSYSSAKPTYNDYVPECKVMGEEKQLALMFLDIRNFTAFMEQRTAHDAVYVTRKMFMLFNDSIREAGGRIIETIGDSIYASFGLNGSINDAVKAAMAASTAIFHDLEIFNTTYAKPNFGITFEIGIGVHQGNVLVGEYNVNGTKNLSVMGLPVNIAARLQAETKTLNNDFIISEDVFELLNMDDNVIESRLVNLRGISQPLMVRLAGNPYQPLKCNKPKDDMLDYYIAMAG